MKRPHNIEIEQAIIAACLIDQNLFNEAQAQGITHEHFYNLKHKLIFDSFSKVIKEIGSIDELTVSQYLRENDCSNSVIWKSLDREQRDYSQLDFIGLNDLLRLTSAIDHTGGFKAWLKILNDNYVARQIIDHMVEKIEQVSETPSDALKAVEETASWLVGLDRGDSIKTQNTVAELTQKALVDIKEVMSGKKSRGLKLGLTDIDKNLSLINGSVTVIAARPSMGKSALAMGIAVNAGVPTLVFSLEMSGVELSKRLFGICKHLNLKRFYEGVSVDVRELEDAASQIGDLPIWIEEAVPMDIYKMRSIARKAKLENDIGLIVIDYLQLADPTDTKMSREQQISEISRNIKLMAKELNIPVVSLAQLNRQVEQRDPPRPRLSDLRDSGSIEQDADNVLFISPTEKDKDGTKYVAGGRMMIDIAKNREGPTDQHSVTFIKQLTKFTNYADEPR